MVKKRKQNKKKLVGIVLITLLMGGISIGMYMLYKDIQNAKGLLTLPEDPQTNTNNETKEDIDNQQEQDELTNEESEETDTQDSGETDNEENSENKTDTEETGDTEEEETIESNSTLSVDEELNLFKIFLDEIRQELPNTAKASSDVTLVYIKRDPTLLTKSFNDYPFELQNSSNRVKNELTKLEKYSVGVKLIDNPTNQTDNSETEETTGQSEEEPIKVGDKYNVDGELKVHRQEHPLGTVFSIQDIESEEVYYFILNTEATENALEKQIDEKVRIRTQVLEVNPESLIYQLTANPTRL